MIFKRKMVAEKQKPTVHVESAILPRLTASGEPLQPRDQPGYYPGFSTMAQKSFWEPATRELLEMRVYDPPPVRHFSPTEANFWRAVFDHLLPQTDRIKAKRIPILEPLDERLYQNRTAGFRFENMPRDAEAYRLGQLAIDEESSKRFDGTFVDLPHEQQDLVLQAIHDQKPKAAKAIWKQMSIGRFWQLILQDALESYYAHPWAWDEIGFGGPAYPRAYTRLEKGEPEPWEIEEQRYEWLAPESCVSDTTEETHHLHTEIGQNG